MRQLSPYGCKLLLDLLASYNGLNNGDLSTSWTLMRPRGWRSKATLTKAIRELQSKEIIWLTRAGGRRSASLYALTFLNVDECRGKIDTKPTVRPPDAWLKHEPLQLPIKRALTRIADDQQPEPRVQMANSR